MNRIRYIKSNQKDYLESVRLFVGNKGGFYRVYINTVDHTYKIKNIKSQKIMRSTEKDGRKPPKLLRIVKVQAKKALESLGVKFQQEMRGL